VDREWCGILQTMNVLIYLLLVTVDGSERLTGGFPCGLMP
jgi:hypothetical protein